MMINIHQRQRIMNNLEIALQKCLKADEKTEKKGTQYAVVTKLDGFFYGGIFIDGKLLEAPKLKGYWTEENCIEWINKRVDFWRAKKQLDIPYVQYEKEKWLNVTALGY